MKPPRILLLIIAALCAPALSGQFAGLSGRALADAVRALYAPSAAPAAWTPEAWADGADVSTTIVPPAWWHADAPADLYNLVLMSAGFDAARRSYPPAPLASVAASGPGWETGTAAVAPGLDTDAWQPAPDRRGDLARRIMYLALMYPQPLWHDRAAMLLADGPWPLLTPYGTAILMDWHRADPPDARELAEAARIADAQGGSNPILDLPDLPDYLWGDLAGMGYTPPAHRHRTPLRAAYSRSTDAEIDLYSPYVPAGAVWAIDGRTVEGQSIATATLTPGRHTLTFTAASATGHLIIEINP